MNQKNKSGVVVIEKGLYLSQPYLDLSGAAPQVLAIFWTKRKMGKIGRRGKREHVIQNNGQIIFTYREAQKNYGIQIPRFTRAIDQLVEKGFIDIERLGGGVDGKPTLYALSERWQHYDTENKIAKNQQARPKDTRPCGFRMKKNSHTKTCTPPHTKTCTGKRKSKNTRTRKRVRSEKRKT